jgi:hypothetical protein
MNIPEIIATDRAPSAITGSRWHACSRHMWFKFRHVKTEQYKQETLRTFEIGHAMEDLICKWIGRPVHFREAELKNRWGGTLGKIDGIIQDGEGNFVLVVSEGAFAGKPTAFYDLFRVDNGKIAEHWDTIETILPKESWKNSNGKFNF